MPGAEPNLRLSQIQTLWTLVGQAHDGPSAAVVAAQEQLLERYGGAIRRYLLGALRDEESASELFQEFACRFLRGELRGANAERGRFRSFVKGVLFHMIADWHRKRKRQPRQIGSETPEPAVAPDSDADDRAFLAGWRDELLARAWAALARMEQETGRPLHTVLRFRAEHAELSSTRMAEELGKLSGEPLTAAGVRQTLHRAREQFASLLLEEVEHSLPEPTPELLAEELGELELLDYCRPALAKRGMPA